MIYTSGSTGRPKGVVVSHRAIVNRLLWTQAEYGLRSGDRVLQKTPAGFDVSVWEFFWPLQAGATLVIARPDGHRDPVYLAGLIRDEAVTTVHFVPSMLAVFLAELGEAAENPEPGPLRRVLCSGEALPLDLAEQAAARLGVPVHNLYGPTEAAVDVTFWEHRPEPGAVSVPIGPCGTRGCTCWTRGCGRCRRGWPGSCIWPVRSWRGGIWGGRGCRRSGSWPVRSGSRVGGCIGPGTWCAGVRTECWTTSAGPTSR
nr:hypothetical protein GCM10020093_038810 [Planobispora longispora]